MISENEEQIEQGRERNSEHDRHMVIALFSGVIVVTVIWSVFAYLGAL